METSAAVVKEKDIVHNHHSPHLFPLLVSSLSKEKELFLRGLGGA